MAESDMISLGQICSLLIQIAILERSQTKGYTLKFNMMSPTMNDATLGKNENEFDFKILP